MTKFDRVQIAIVLAILAISIPAWIFYLLITYLVA